MSFNTLGLSAELLSAIAHKGYNKTTPIQRQAIPVILEGRDVMASAQTGTGKTAAFTLPLLQRLQKHPQGENNRRVRALILTPTRELAAQVHASVCDYGRHLNLRSSVVFGGVSINPQIKKIRRGIDILVATPGRLLDLVNQKVVDLSKVEILVLDEADRMLDMGFMPDVCRIISLLPKKKQTLLFSATFSNSMKDLAYNLLKKPARIEVASRRNSAAEGVSQLIHPVDRSRKRELLSFLIGSNHWNQVLVFTRTKHAANRLSDQLEKDGLSSMAIHGNKSQGARTRALENFKRGKLQILVATDIASRGLDINQLPHVINFELPMTPEDYVHRIGRTGRAGKEGVAISLVCVDELKMVKDIERLLNVIIPRVVIAGYEPDPTIKPVNPNKKQIRRKSSAKPKRKYNTYRGGKTQPNKTRRSR